MPGTPATTPRLGIARYANADAVDFAGQVNAVSDMVDSKVALDSRVAPVGAMEMYAGAADPAGGVWFICDGRELSRTTYSALWDALRNGTTSSPYGNGNGTTTFNLPDMRGRGPIGVGTGTGLTARTRAQQVGTETHTLSIGQLPQHHHVLADEAGAQVNVAHNSGGNGPTPNAPVSGYNGGFMRAGAVANTDGTLASVGSAHNNMQPSLGVNFIIKALA